MQWLIDLIQEWVLSLGYATQAWVLEQLCTSTCRVYRAIPMYLFKETWTKILFDAEDWDINGEFANHRFTAKEAGYFQVNLSVLGGVLTDGKRWNVAIYKNGNPHSTTWENNGAAGYNGSYISDIVHLNGTTDFVEGWAYHNEAAGKFVYVVKPYTFMSIHQLSKDSW